MARLLPGGFVSAVVQIGDTVHRPPSPNAGFVHDLLDHLERYGWDGAPRYLGMDAAGREVLVPPDQHLVGTRVTPSCLLDELLFVQWSALHGLGLAPSYTTGGGEVPRRPYCQRRSWPRSSPTREAVSGRANR